MDLLTEEDVDALRAIADRIREQNGEVGYGYFLGGDPRDFTPDEESCSAEEIENHKRACQLMDEGKIQFVDGRHHFPLIKDGEVIGHVTQAAFGIGMYTVKDPEIDKLASSLDEWVDAVRKTEDSRR